MKKLAILLFLLAFSQRMQPLLAQALDPSFQANVLKMPYLGGQTTGAQVVLVQPDGKILVAGGFDFASGTVNARLIRLNANGTLDATFNPAGTGANGFIAGMALQPNGKIIIVGGFTAYNGVPVLAQARLNTDGTLDPTFAALPLTSLRQLGTVAIQPDGKVLIGSTAGFDTTPKPTLVRLNSDGTPDVTFSAPASVLNDFVRAILVQADGKILVGGIGSSTTSPLATGLQRFNTDGSVDNTFTSPTGSLSTVQSLAQQPDGKLLVGGTLFQAGSSTSNPGVLRLLLSGATDSTWGLGSGPATTSGSSATVRTLLLQPSGNVLVGGTFTLYNGVARGRVARLLPTGAVDTNFATGSGANGLVNALATTASGQVLAVGSLTQYDGGSARTGLVQLSAAGAEDATFVAPVLEDRGTVLRAALLGNGQVLALVTAASLNGTALSTPTNQLRRFNADGTLDASYTSLATFSNTAFYGAQPDGSAYVVQYANSQISLARVLPNGGLDNTFTSLNYVIAGITSARPVAGVVVQPDGKLLVYGNFTTYGGAARNGIVRLNANGTLDASFVPPASSPDRAVDYATVQASGKIVLAYQEVQTGNALNTGEKFIRLNSDGTADATFGVGTGLGAGVYAALLAQPNGKLLVYGDFTSFNGQPTPYSFVRLNEDGTLDNTFNGVANYYVPRVAQANGLMLATVGSYGAAKLVRLTSTGSLDPTFAPISTPLAIFTGDESFAGFLLQPDDKIIAYGTFRTVLGQVRVGLTRLLPGMLLAAQASAATHSLVVYPNPTRQQLRVVLPVLSSATQATLLDVTGQVVGRWLLPAQQPEASLDLSAVASGLYILRIVGTAGTYQQKVVVAP